MKRQYLYLAAFFLLVSCHKDADTVVSVIDTPDAPETLITTRLASITDTLSTDAGNSLQFFAGKDNDFAQSPFAITDGQLIRRDRELIQLHTPDHEFYKVIALIENDVNYTDWSIPTLQSASGQSTSDAQFDLTGAGVLQIPANSLTKSDGSTYSGPYTIEWAVFAPDTDESRFIPSYTALKNDGQLVQVLAEMSLYLSLKAGDGSPLTLKAGTFIDQSPYNAPSWYFDAEVAAWTNNGDEHKIEVSKSGYYMIGEDVAQVRISGTLMINGQPAPHYPMTISYASTQRQLYSTNAGAWAMLLPAETSCVASVKLPCGAEKEIPFEVADISSAPVSITITDAGVTNSLLQGSVKGCAAEDVDDPMLIVKGTAPQFFFPSDNEVGLNYPSCVGSSITVQAVNQYNMESGPAISWESRDTIDLKTAFACNAARDEYLYLTVDGDQKMYWDMSSDFTMHDRLLIQTGGSDPNTDFQIFISGDMVGDYEDTKLNILFEDPQLGSRGFSLYCPTATSGCGFTKFTITHFPEESGQWIRGYFQGRFWIKTFHPLTAGYRDVSGEFQVYREF